MPPDEVFLSGSEQLVVDSNMNIVKVDGVVTVSFIKGIIEGSSKVTVSPTAPSSPQVNDLWIDTS